MYRKKNSSKMCSFSMYLFSIRRMVYFLFQLNACMKYRCGISKKYIYTKLPLEMDLKNALQ